jgi:hypothetical protein
LAPKGFSAFTTTAKSGILRVLANKCRVAAAFGPGQTQTPFHEFLAIWDTGATHSAVTQNVVNACGLKPTGMKDVKHAAGVDRTLTYIVNIALPTGVAFANLEVTLFRLADADLLIGMDIISMGDFAVTNVGGMTTFSYRFPSIQTIDYAAEARRIQKAAQTGKPPFYQGVLGKKKRH